MGNAIATLLNPTSVLWRMKGMHLMRIMSSCKAIRIDPSILVARPNDKKGPKGNVCGTIFKNNLSGQWNGLTTISVANI